VVIFAAQKLGINQTMQRILQAGGMRFCRLSWTKKKQMWRYWTSHELDVMRTNGVKIMVITTKIKGKTSSGKQRKILIKSEYMVVAHQSV